MVKTNRNFFFRSESINNAAIEDGSTHDFGFQAANIIIVNDSNSQILNFSFRTPTIDGILTKDDQPITFDRVTIGKIWLASPSGQNIPYRIWAWRGDGT